MQEVEKLCDDGHYPICLFEDGEYAIFTPFRRNTDGVIIETDKFNIIRQSEAELLWNKWNHFKTGAFYRGEKGMVEVLQELNPILKSKIK
jgi:hypothetical protein